MEQILLTVLREAEISESEYDNGYSDGYEEGRSKGIQESEEGAEESYQEGYKEIERFKSFCDASRIKDIRIAGGSTGFVITVVYE